MSEFLRLGANLLFHSIMVDGKSGILEKNMMNLENGILLAFLVVYFDLLGDIN